MYKNVDIKHKKHVNKDIRNLIIIKRNAFRKFRKTKDDKYLNVFERTYQSIALELEAKHSEKLLRDINNSNSYFSLYKKIKTENRSQILNTMTDDSNNVYKTDLDINNIKRNQ